MGKFKRTRSIARKRGSVRILSHFIMMRSRIRGSYVAGALLDGAGSFEHAQLIARELEGHAVPSDVNRQPAGRSARCLRSSVGPRRGGLNGRRNAVKPFCHSRRSRAARDNSSGVLRDRSAPLAFLLFTSIFRVLEYVQLVLIYIHIVVFMTMITVLIYRIKKI